MNYTLTSPALEWDKATTRFSIPATHLNTHKETWLSTTSLRNTKVFGFGLSCEQTSYHNVNFRKCARALASLDAKMTRERSNVPSSAIQVYVGYKSHREEHDTKRA
mmetsp:Transcript_8072/g.12815  ORF Transcript_8072/g.12815 Transcript_8072/m.12815 type:complete len:106 (-) Transcript_8072:145-462(-)